MSLGETPLLKPKLVQRNHHKVCVLPRQPFSPAGEQGEGTVLPAIQKYLLLSCVFLRGGGGSLNTFNSTVLGTVLLVWVFNE